LEILTHSKFAALGDGTSSTGQLVAKRFINCVVKPLSGISEQSWIILIQHYLQTETAMSDEPKVVSVHVEKHEGAGIFGDDLYTATVTTDNGTTRSATGSKEGAIEIASERAKSGNIW
jgi:hypothetical protein